MVRPSKKNCNISGVEFGRLVAISPIGEKINTQTFWKCVCSCGNEIEVKAENLLHPRGRKSCGCLYKESPTLLKPTHGMSYTRIYKIWDGMKDRCLNPRNSNYHNYGGRGITVCDRWLHSFENFYADMGDAPKGCSLDRIDNELGYSPENCRWADDKTQGRNRRTNRHVLGFGQTKCIADWCDGYGISRDNFVYHLNKGRSVEEIVNKHIEKRSAS